MTMNARELRTRSTSELETELRDLRREAFNLRMQQGVGQLTQYDQIKALRRNIARVKTVLNERKSS